MKLDPFEDARVVVVVVDGNHILKLHTLTLSRSAYWHMHLRAKQTRY